MPLHVTRTDFTKLKVDAIVNSANRSLLGGGGVDGYIHRLAGPELLEECKKLDGCDIGSAKVTKAYNLPCKHIIHTVGPIWQGGMNGEEELLASCYRKSLELAKELNCASIALPLISGGAFGFPKEKVIKIATDEITSFLLNNEMTIYLIIWSKEALQISKKFFAAVEEYIDDNYVAKRWDDKDEARKLRLLAEKNLKPQPPKINSFRELLNEWLNKKQMTAPQCYKSANLDKRLFSKILSGDNYHPKKSTVLALSIGLKLNLQETKELLAVAGYVLSAASKSDMIVKFFIEQGNYDIFEINGALFDKKLPVLGSKLS